MPDMAPAICARHGDPAGSDGRCSQCDRAVELDLAVEEAIARTAAFPRRRTSARIEGHEVSYLDVDEDALLTFHLTDEAATKHLAVHPLARVTRETAGGWEYLQVRFPWGVVFGPSRRTDDD